VNAVNHAESPSPSTRLLPHKRHVARAFAHAAHTYDQHAFLQREVAQRLCERLDYIKLTPTRVLDLGSGTGYFTRKLRERFQDAAIVSADLAFDMLTFAREQLPKTPLLARLFSRSAKDTFVGADAEALPFADATFDAVCSNLTLQWCDSQKTANEVLRILRPQGLFMFTTFGPDTLKELRAAFRRIDNRPHVNEFVDMHDIGDALVQAGFADPVMDQETITLTYADLKSMLRELKGIGAHNVLPGRAAGLTGKNQWQQLLAAYEHFRVADRLPSTWEVVYGHAWKPDRARQKNVDGAQSIDLEDFRKMIRESKTRDNPNND
jgi:malonyl-CoA O-methyltransferase